MLKIAAELKWCPFARAAGYKSDVALGNRGPEGEPHGACCCITTHCMAWGVIKDPGMWGAAAPPSEDQGYCFLMLKS